MNRYTATLIWILGIVSSSSLLAATPPKAPESYPTRDVVWLGSFAGQIAVNPLTELVTTRQGDIQWKVADGESVANGTSLAICGFSQIAQSEKELALDEADLPNKLRQAEWTHREKIATGELKLEELKNKLQKLDLSEEENEVLGPSISKRIVGEKQKLRNEIEKLNDRLDPTISAEELRIEQEKLRLTLEKARLEQLETIRSFEILAPHAGILKIERSGYIRGSEVAGTLENRGIASVTLQIADPEILNEKPEQLQVSVADSRGQVHIGNFDRIEKDSSIRMGFVIYHFKLEPKPNLEIPSDMTGERLVTLSRKLGQMAYIVPKTDFLFENTKEVQQLGWAGFVQQRWPGFKILLVGPRSLAVIREE